MHAAAAVMPPFDWASLATPEDDAEADGLAPEDGWMVGVADVRGVTVLGFARLLGFWGPGR